jgi:hypothetical protein
MRRCHDTLTANTTTVKLTTGALAVFSPVALTPLVREKLSILGGDVAYIIAPDTEHHIFISDWKSAFPTAKLIGPEGLPEKRLKQNQALPDEHWDFIFSAATKHEMTMTPEFDADFAYEFVDGHANKEIVLLFKPERVLVQADLMFNLPPTEQYSRVPEELERVEKQQSPGILDRMATATNTARGDGDDLKWVRRWVWYVAAKDKKSFDESMRRIDSWDFGTVVPCHGDVLEGEEGKAAFRRVMEWHLAGKHQSVGEARDDGGAGDKL